jgi:hypothetical protein
MQLWIMEAVMLRRMGMAAALIAALNMSVMAGAMAAPPGKGGAGHGAPHAAVHPGGGGHWGGRGGWGGGGGGWYEDNWGYDEGAVAAGMAAFAIMGMIAASQARYHHCWWQNHRRYCR